MITRDGSRAVSGQRSAVSGQRSAVSGQRSAVSGRVLLLACAALLAGPTPSSYGGGSTPLNLDSDRASEVVGGVGANIVWPGANNWGQSYDNLRFKVEISATANSTIEVGAWAEGYGMFFSTGSDTVAIPSSGPGLLHRRYNWGVSGNYDLVMRYKDGSGSWVDCAGSNPGDTDQHLLSTVKVHAIKVHNTKEPDNSWQGHWTTSSVDSTAAPIPGADSNTIDGVYGQRGDFIGVGYKTQWRRSSVNTVTVAAGCTDMKAVMESCPGNPCNFSDLLNCSAFTSCQNSMMNAAGHNNDDYAHIYVVETLACWNGLHLPNSNGKKWTAIVDTEGPQGGKEFRGTTVLSHELGHTQGLGHVTASWANCGAGSNLNRNLMCLNGGRLLQNSSLPQQCDIIRSSTGFHDFN